MSCNSIQQKLSAYLDGELSGFEMLDVRNHLNGCPTCAAEANELRAIKSILGAVPSASVDDAFRCRLREAVFSAPKAQKMRPLPILAVAGAAFFAALGISLIGLRTQHHHTVPTHVVSYPDQTAFDLSRDQAYQAGGDTFNDGSLIITASAPTNGSR
jgi:anti-sigma factor RsiW